MKLKNLNFLKMGSNNCEGHGGGHREASEDRNENMSRGIEQERYLWLTPSPPDEIDSRNYHLNLMDPPDGKAADDLDGQETKMKMSEVGPLVSTTNSNN